MCCLLNTDFYWNSNRYVECKEYLCVLRVVRQVRAFCARMASSLWLKSQSLFGTLVITIRIVKRRLPAAKIGGAETKKSQCGQKCLK